MKVMTVVPKEILALYNKVMLDNGEEPYMIECGNIHDCSHDTLLDTAWCEANPNAPVSGPDCPPDPPEFILTEAYLIEEIRYNLIEKQGDMADDMVNNGDWSPQKAAGMKRRNRRIVEQFRLSATRAVSVEPWFIANIER